MTWDNVFWHDIFWHGVQIFFSIWSLGLFIAYRRLSKVVDYLRSERNGLNSRCNLLELQVDKLAFTLDKTNKLEGSYRDNATSDSNEDTVDEDEDFDPHEKPFVSGQIVEVKFDDDGYPEGSGPWFSAIFVGVIKDHNGHSALKLKLGDETLQYRLSRLNIIHPAESSHV